MLKKLGSIVIFALLALQAPLQADVLSETTRSAENGNPESMYQLGRLAFYEGNFSEAYRWYLAASKRNHANAQLALGLMYVNGEQAVPFSYQRAHLWFTLAAEAGNAQAGQYRTRLEQVLTPSQLAASRGEAQRWRVFFRRSR